MKRKVVLSEQQIINAIKKVIGEARRNPNTNVDEDFTSFYNRMLKKAPIWDIFVSFRDDMHVTDVNPNNDYGTPTGFYSYPLELYQPDDDPTESDFRRLFPFAENRRYINFFILKSHDGILTAHTEKSTLDGYAEKIKELYSDKSEVIELCNSFIHGSYTSDYIDHPDRKLYHDTHLFWLLLYDVAGASGGWKVQTTINLICRNIGVNGFIDYGDTYIHKAEESQAVFFKVKNLGEIFIYERPKFNSKTFKNVIQNKDYEVHTLLKGGVKLIDFLGRYATINSDNKLVSKQMFDYVTTFHKGIAKIKLKDKWNFINEKGEIISPDQWFDMASYFSSKFAMVELKNKKNFIDKNGKLLSPNQWFDDIKQFDGEFASVKSNGVWGYINQYGELFNWNMEPLTPK